MSITDYFQKTKTNNATSSKRPRAQVISGHLQQLKLRGYNSLSEFLSKSNKHIYIGRDMTRFVPGAEASDWANDVRPEECGGLKTCLQIYEERIRARPDLMKRLPELDGCVLVCWCRKLNSPQKEELCHGDVLNRLLSEYYLKAEVNREDIIATSHA